MRRLVAVALLYVSACLFPEPSTGLEPADTDQTSGGRGDGSTTGAADRPGVDSTATDSSGTQSSGTGETDSPGREAHCLEIPDGPAEPTVLLRDDFERRDGAELGDTPAPGAPWSPGLEDRIFLDSGALSFRGPCNDAATHRVVADMGQPIDLVGTTLRFSMHHPATGSEGHPRSAVTVNAGVSETGVGTGVSWLGPQETDNDSYMAFIVSGSTLYEPGIYTGPMRPGRAYFQVEFEEGCARFTVCGDALPPHGENCRSEVVDMAHPPTPGSMVRIESPDCYGTSEQNTETFLRVDDIELFRRY